MIEFIKSAVFGERDRKISYLEGERRKLNKKLNNSKEHRIGLQGRIGHLEKAIEKIEISYRPDFLRDCQEELKFRIMDADQPFVDIITAVSIFFFFVFF